MKHIMKHEWKELFMYSFECAKCQLVIRGVYSRDGVIVAFVFVEKLTFFPYMNRTVFKTCNERVMEEIML